MYSLRVLYVFKVVDSIARSFKLYCDNLRYLI